MTERRSYGLKNVKSVLNEYFYEQEGCFMKTLLRYLMIVTSVSFTARGGDFQKKRSLSMFESVLVGSAAGATEVAFAGQPLSYRANMLSLKQSCSTNPVHWYKGFSVSLAGMAPITALQKVGRVTGERFLQARQDESLSDAQKLSVACLAGAAAATVATPSEAVPVYMQCMEKAGTPKTSMQAFKELKLQVWRGFSLTAGRDGLFTMGYGSLAALAKARATQAYGDSPVVSVGSGALTGGAIAVATQPLAVVKTMLQGDPF